MGDVGKGLYVSEDVVPVYKDMLRLSTIITPNQFETESVQ
jgi:pyridoxine kinase